MSEVLSKGFRFHPADEELVRHYLMRKTSSPDFRCFIKTMEVFDSEPWTLPHVRDPCFGEQEWYYFVEKNPSGHKSLSEEGTVPTTHGWRKHPLEEIIKDNDGDGEEEEGTIIGLKSKFHFYLYNGSDKPRTPTSWSMTEYKLVESEKWVICHLAYTHWNNDFEKPRYGGVEHPPLGWKLVKELVTSQAIPPSLHTFGFRFHPTDKELVTLYLAPKNASSDFQCFIKELEMFAKEPWLMELERSAFYREKEWYFFVRKAWSKREEQNLRFSLDGKKKQWRINGEVSNVVDNEAAKRIIGLKTTFSFNLSQSVHSRSGWKVVEYTLPPRSNSKWAICKLSYTETGSCCPLNRTSEDEHPKLEFDVLKNLHETSATD